MPDWRKKQHPCCPKCGKSNSHQKHKDCSQGGRLWIDINSGQIRCNGCGKIWSLEDTTHYCSCGAKYTGGEIWQGMAHEIGRIANLAWVQRLAVKKGYSETHYKGQWKSSGGCFISTAVCTSLGRPDDCEELVALRAFRDNHLLHSPVGSILVRDYYAFAPRVVGEISRRDDQRVIYSQIYYIFLKPVLSHLYMQDHSAAVRMYINMCEYLQDLLRGTLE